MSPITSRIRSAPITLTGRYDVFSGATRVQVLSLAYSPILQSADSFSPTTIEQAKYPLTGFSTSAARKMNRRREIWIFGIFLRDLVLLDGVGQGSEALYLDRDLISCLQPHLRVAGSADAWWRACDYHIAWDECHTLGEKGDELGDREDHLLRRPILHDLAVQDAAYGEVLGVFDLICSRDDRP